MKWIGCSDRVDWSGVALDKEVRAQDRWCLDPVVPDDVDEVGFIGCAEDLDRAHLERRLRAAGFDPLGVPIIGLSDVDVAGDSRIRARVAAATARAGEYRGCSQENLKPVVPPVMTRRSFLAFAAPSYRVVPRPDESCGAADGCRACVEVCPHGALTWSRGEVTQDRLACAGCGRCVTACPVAAMVNPVFLPAQIEAEIVALADVIEQFGVVLTCARGPVPSAPAGWFNVAVPCVGMLVPHWIMGPLFLGAAAVVVDKCGCAKETDADEQANAAADFARLWLDASGITPDRLLPDEPYGDPGPALPHRLGSSAFGERGAAAVAEALAFMSVAGDASPLGVVAIDDDLCTGCEMCATVCPSAALQSVPIDGFLTIEFDPASCTACGQCVDRCPEPGALSLARVADSAELERGRRMLVSHTLAQCKKCGGSVAPQAALDRVAAAIGDEPEILKQITSVCVDCRGTTMVF